MSNTLDEILNWASEAAREWKTIRMGIDPVCHHEYASEIFDRHREAATHQIQALITEARIDELNELANELTLNTDIDLTPIKDRLTQLKENN